MAALTNEQIKQKKQQLAGIMKEAKALQEELMEAGAIPIDDDELDGVAGGRSGEEIPPEHYEPKGGYHGISDFFGFFY